MDTKYKSYFHGKNLKKNDGNVPTKGEPNSFIDIRFKKNGSIKRRRKIGKDGLAVKDIDTPQGSIKKYHVHNFHKDGTRDEDHKEASKKEIREMKKADRKRRTRLWQKKNKNLLMN